MSQCPQCGAPTTADQPFCGTCGTALASAGQQQQAGEQRTQIRQPSQQPPAPGQAPDQPQQPQQGQPQQAPQQWQQPPQQGQQQWGQQPPQQGQQQWGQPPQQAPQQQQQWGQQQYAGQPGYQQAPQQQGPFGGGSAPSFDFSKILTGNWVGAGMVAGAAFGVALVLGALFAFTTAEDLDVASAIAMTLMLAVSTFGPNLVVDLGDGFPGPGFEDGSMSIGQYPLLITILALAVAVYLFRRVTANYPDARTALLDAARTAVILMLGLTVVAIAMRIWNPEIKGYESSTDTGGVNVATAGLGLPEGGETHVSIVGAIFLGFLLLFVVLAISCFVRGDWLQGKWRLVHDWVAAPLVGIAAVAVLTTVAGLIYLLAVIIGEDSTRGFAEIMRLLAVTPALGVRLLGLGVFSNVGSKSSYEVGDDDDDEESFDRLADFADDHGALFWIAPVVAIAIAAAGVYAVIWKSTDKTKVLRNALVFLGLLLIAVPFLVRFANIHAGTSASAEEGDDDYSGSLWAGVDGFQTTFFFFLLCLVVAAVLLLLTGNLDMNALKSKAQGMAQHAQQAQQGQWGQQPPQQGQPQQWGQQPPQQGQPPQQWGQQPPQQGQPQQWGQQPPQQGQPPQQWGQQPPQQGGQPGQGWGPPQQ